MSGRVGIGSPRFLAFLIAQALGTANDNALLVLVLMTVASATARDVRYSRLTTALFPIPFLLFSPLAGYLSDRFAKHRFLFWAKSPEILMMMLATIGLVLRSISFLFVVLFLSITRGAFFSPAKYGILPEVFEDKVLSEANGILELTNDLSIVVGAIAGVYIYSVFRQHLANAAIIFVVVACLGTVAIAFAPKAPAGNRGAHFAWSVVNSFYSDFAEVRRAPTLFYTVVGIAWFGFLGSFFLTVVPVFGTSELSLGEGQIGILLATLVVGMGLGAVIAGARRLLLIAADR